MVDGAIAYFDAIDRMGGMVEAIERGFAQKEIAESSYRFQQAFERQEKIMGAVNACARAAERDRVYRRRALREEADDVRRPARQPRRCGGAADARRVACGGAH